MKQNMLLESLSLLTGKKKVRTSVRHRRPCFQALEKKKERERERETSVLGQTALVSLKNPDRFYFKNLTLLQTGLEKDKYSHVFIEIKHR